MVKHNRNATQKPLKKTLLLREIHANYTQSFTLCSKKLIFQCDLGVCLHGTIIAKGCVNLDNYAVTEPNLETAPNKPTTNHEKHQKLL